jgi:UDP-N-acetyl-D-galactosamine dehydrogenase
LTFKENVPDLRNSKVPDIINELREYGVQVVVHDPIAESEEAVHEYGIKLVDFKQIKDVDGVIMAVAHRSFLEMGMSELLRPLRDQNSGVLIDVKSILDPSKVPSSNIGAS